MNAKGICMALVCCVTATITLAGEGSQGKEKAQPMSEPNPIKAYVNVIPQGGEGKTSTFVLCEHTNKGCEKQVHTKKHLAVSNQTTKFQVDTARENRNP